MGQNYILTQSYKGTDNKDYFLISETEVINSEGEIYNKIIAKCTFVNEHNTEFILCYIVEEIPSNIINIDDNENYYKNINDASLTTNSIIYKIDNNKVTDLKNNKDYPISKINNYGIVKEEQLIYFNDNNGLLDYSGVNTHESIQYIQKNYHKLNASVDMILANNNSSSSNESYITLAANSWSHDSVNYKYHNYIQKISGLENLIFNEEENRGAVQNLHAIVAPQDIYIKPKQNNENSSKIRLYSKVSNDTSNNKYYYFYANTLPQTQTYKNNTTYYLRTSNNYIENVDSYDYKKTYYIPSESNEVRFYKITIPEDRVGDADLIETGDIYYYNKRIGTSSEGEAIWEQVLINFKTYNEDDIYNYQLNILPLSNNITINVPPFTSGTETISTYSVNPVLIKDEDVNGEISSNEILAVSNIYRLDQVDNNEDAEQVVKNRQIYNICNVRMIDIDNQSNIVFACDNKPSEDLHVYVLLLKDRIVKYNIPTQEG